LAAHTLYCTDKDNVTCRFTGCKHKSTVWSEALEHLDKAHEMRVVANGVSLYQVCVDSGKTPACISDGNIINSASVDGGLRIFFVSQYKKGPAGRFKLMIHEATAEAFADNSYRVFVASSVQAVVGNADVKEVYESGEYLAVTESQLSHRRRE